MKAQQKRSLPTTTPLEIPPFTPPAPRNKPQTTSHKCCRESSPNRASLDTVPFSWPSSGTLWSHSPVAQALLDLPGRSRMGQATGTVGKCLCLLAQGHGQAMTMRMEAAGHGSPQGMGKSWEPSLAIFLSQDGDSQLRGQQGEVGRRTPWYLHGPVGFSLHGEAEGLQKATAAQGWVTNPMPWSLQVREEQSKTRQDSGSSFAPQIQSLSRWAHFLHKQELQYYTGWGRTSSFFSTSSFLALLQLQIWSTSSLSLPARNRKSAWELSSLFEASLNCSEDICSDGGGEARTHWKGLTDHRCHHQPIAVGNGTSSVKRHQENNRVCFHSPSAMHLAPHAFR